VCIAVVAVVVMALADLGVRTRTSAIPAPTRWLGPEMALKEQQIDALQRDGGASTIFIGSSNVDAGVDPSALTAVRGPRPAYNAATGAASIAMIDFWARNVAISRLRPDVVIVGLTSRELNQNDPEQQRLEREFEDAPAVKHLRGAESILERAERRLEGVSALFRYRAVLRDPRYARALVGIAGHRTATTYGETVAGDGQYGAFADERYVPSGVIEHLFRSRAVNRYEIGDSQRSTLRALLRFINAHGARAVVVNMPVTADYVRFHPNGRRDYDRATATMSGEAALAGARFVDAGVWPDELFADPGHLNRAGAKRLTAMLDGVLRALPAGAR
jgi:hypothetical protein